MCVSGSCLFKNDFLYFLFWVLLKKKWSTSANLLKYRMIIFWPEVWWEIISAPHDDISWWTILQLLLLSCQARKSTSSSPISTMNTPWHQAGHVCSKIHPIPPCLWLNMVSYHQSKNRRICLSVKLGKAVPDILFHPNLKNLIHKDDAMRFTPIVV